MSVRKTKRPLKTWKLGSGIDVALWGRENKQTGDRYFDFTLQRSYSVKTKVRQPDGSFAISTDWERTGFVPLDWADKITAVFAEMQDLVATAEIYTTEDNRLTLDPPDNELAMAKLMSYTPEQIRKFQDFLAHQDQLAAESQTT